MVGDLKIAVEFDDYFRAQFAALSRFVCTLGASVDEAREVAQRSFVDIAPLFDAIRTPAPWLRQTAMNRLAEVRGIEGIRGGGVRKVDVDDLAVKVLMSLPKRQREMIAWSVDGYPPKAVAAVLGISAATASGHLRHAVARLCDLLPDIDPLAGPTRREALFRHLDATIGALVAEEIDTELGLKDAHRRMTVKRGIRGRRLSLPAVGPGSAQKVALAEEAEGLAGIDIGWEDAAVRLAEIAEQWPAVAAVDAVTEQMLWDRIVAAHERFRQQPRVPGASGAVTVDAPADPPKRAPEAATAISRAEAEAGLRDLVAQTGFQGPAWEALARAAAEYCVSTVIAWLRSGHIPRGVDLDPETRAGLARPWSGDAMTSIVADVAGRALVRFRELRLEKGGWTPSDQATLVTELCDGCVEALPGALRTYAVGALAQSGENGSAHGNDTTGVGRAAAVLRDAGYTRIEIAEVLGLADEAAVTRAVTRHHKAVRHV